MAKILIFAGAALILAGVLIHFDLIKYFPLGRLPGDIYIQKENFTFYMPVTSAFIVSAVFIFISKYFG